MLIIPIELIAFSSKVFIIPTQGAELKAFWISSVIRAQTRLLLFYAPLFALSVIFTTFIMAWIGDRPFVSPHWWLDNFLPSSISSFNQPRIRCREAYLRGLEYTVIWMWVSSALALILFNWSEIYLLVILITISAEIASGPAALVNILHLLLLPYAYALLLDTVGTTLLSFDGLLSHIWHIIYFCLFIYILWLCAQALTFIAPLKVQLLSY